MGTASAEIKDLLGGDWGGFGLRFIGNDPGTMSVYITNGFLNIGLGSIAIGEGGSKSSCIGCNCGFDGHLGATCDATQAASGVVEGLCAISCALLLILLMKKILVN